VLIAGGKVGVMGKRWNNPDFLAGLAEAGGTPELVKFWRSPVVREKFSDVPAFLLPRFTEMAAEVPDTPTGRRIYYERVHCLLALASAARRTDPASIRLDEPPAQAERDLGRVLGQAFHQGCSIADAALATGLPPDRVVAIGKRTIRRAKWLSRVTADPDLAT
jgi:xanthine/CO dehydrogenase XdhC/CoxF family maturation factor